MRSAAGAGAGIASLSGRSRPVYLILILILTTPSLRESESAVNPDEPSFKSCMDSVDPSPGKCIYMCTPFNTPENTHNVPIAIAHSELTEASLSDTLTLAIRFIQQVVSLTNPAANAIVANVPTI